MTVIAVAPITDFLLQRLGDNASQITNYLSEVLNSIGVEISLLVVFLFFGGLIVLNGLVGVATQYALLRIKYDVLIHLLTDTMSKFLRARYLFFSQGDMGKLLNSFQQEVSKVGDTFGHIAQFFANLLQVLIFLLVPLALSPKLTFIFLFGAAITSAPLWMLHSTSYKMGIKNTDTGNVTSRVLHETLTAAKMILSFGRQSIAVNRYKDAIVKHSEISVKFQTLQRGVGLLFQPFGVISALVALYIAYLDGIPFSDIAMVLFALYRCMPIIGLLVQGKTGIEGFIPSYEQLEYLRKDAEELEEPRGGIAFKHFRNGLYFMDVSFSYPGRAPALDCINLKFNEGNMTALIGQSGAGKTTVVDLILGLYQHSHGKILIDGKNLIEYDLNSYRQRVGYVPQDTQLFDTTVRENLLWSSPEATEKEIWHACRLANAEEFVQEFPDKLETVLGDRGIRLSGGQRQRIALARAIIRKPDLLVLDEATSSLDTESERLIQKSIENLSGKMTIVVIAHRLSTIRNADYIYVLDKGKVIEEGKYKTLSKKSDSRLKEMVEHQAL